MLRIDIDGNKVRRTVCNIVQHFGIRNPMGPFPALILSSLMRLMTDANIGVLADVPPERPKFPPTYTYLVLQHFAIA